MARLLLGGGGGAVLLAANSGGGWLNAAVREYLPPHGVQLSHRLVIGSVRGW